MRRYLAYSLILHLLVLMAVIIGMSMVNQRSVQEEEPVSVEVVLVSDKANPPPTAHLAPKAEAQKQSEPPKPPERPEPRPQTLQSESESKPQPPPAKAEPAPPKPVEKLTAKSEAAAPSSAEPAPKPEARAEARAIPRPEKAEPKPAEAKPEAKPMPRAEPEPEPRAEPRPQVRPKPVEAKEEREKAEVKPTPSPERKPEPPKPAESQAKLAQSAKPEAGKPEPKQDATDFTAVAKAVKELHRGPNGGDKPTRPAPAPSAKTTTTADESDFTSQVAQALRSSGPATNRPSLPVTSSEMDAVRRQIERCWNLPAGAKDAGDLIVSIRVEMNADGTPRSAVVQSAGQMQANPLYQAAAESARRAVLNPRCHPFKLPADKYEHWRTMTLIFNPKEMAG